MVINGKLLEGEIVVGQKGKLKGYKVEIALK